MVDLRIYRHHSWCWSVMLIVLLKTFIPVGELHAIVLLRCHSSVPADSWPETGHPFHLHARINHTNLGVAFFLARYSTDRFSANTSGLAALMRCFDRLFLGDSFKVDSARKSDPALILWSPLLLKMFVLLAKGCRRRRRSFCVTTDRNLCTIG